MVGAWEGDVASLEGPRSLTVEELPEAVALSTEVFDPGGTSMGLQFPLLFSADNVGELRVFSEGGRLVSLVGCLHQTILVEGHPLPVGSIGSVCTRPEYRGRGLARWAHSLRHELQDSPGEAVVIHRGANRHASWQRRVCGGRVRCVRG